MSAVKDQVNDLKAVTLSVTGPASYVAGGFAVDPTASLSWLGYLMVDTSAGTLPGCDYEIALNVDTSGNEALGKGVIKVVKYTYSKSSSGAVTGQPAGVTVQSSLSANSASTHVHAIDHNHGNVTSAAMAQAGSGSTSGTTPDELGHTHVFTIPNFSANSPSGGSHTHNRAFEYDHNHAVTTTATDLTATEVSAGTDLSGVTFKVTCFGFGIT